MVETSGEIDSGIALPAKTGIVTQQIELKLSIQDALMKSSPLPVSENDELRRA